VCVCVWGARVCRYIILSFKLYIIVYTIVYTIIYAIYRNVSMYPHNGNVLEKQNEAKL